MKMTIIIENIDQESMMDINYVIKKHLLKIEGMVETETGASGPFPAPQVKVLRIDRSIGIKNRRKNL